MSQKLLRGYHFATEEQWNQCLFVGADRETKEGRIGLRPFAPFGGAPARFASSGGWAPAISCADEALWRNDAGQLVRLPFADDIPLQGPALFSRATRFVATTDTLWVSSDDGALAAFELDSLTRRFVVGVSGVLDITGDGHEGVYALLKTSDAYQIARIDCMGRERSRFALTGVCTPTALVYLARTDQIVVLSAGDTRLVWFAPDGGLPGLTILLSTIRPCFAVAAMGSDGRARIYLAAGDGAPFGGKPQVVTLDSEGIALAALQLDAPSTGVAGNRSQLVVTTAGGLLRFTSPLTVAQDSSDVRASLVTPMLQSPSTADQRLWLRAEATANLPEGCTLEISFASTDDPEARDAALAVTADAKLSDSQKIARLRSQLAWQTYSFNGGTTSVAEQSVSYSVPLFDIHDRFLWVSVALIASPGGGIPVLSELDILYPGRTLMENLPGIYQRAEATPGSFLRSLVGVLESTTQSLDARIAEIGHNIHPETAPGPWLDYIAGWLGLPWDDAMPLEQKRGVVLHAADIARGYGTRAGLEALLTGLMPGTPLRFRITDSTAEFGLSVVGGGACEGSRLPVMLAGLPSTATELGNKTILGKARLPCSDVDDGTARLIGRIRVDVRATAAEQAAWEPWLKALIDAMAPATTRVKLHWLGALAFRQVMELGDELTLEDPPEPHLGTDAVTGVARLPAQRGASLSNTGLDPGTSLN